MKEEKVYIFPENYNKKEKFLGIVEYKMLLVIGIISIINFYTLKYIALDIKLKICLFIVFTGFQSIFILIGVNGENMIDFFKYILKFLMREKIYVYRKTEDDNEKIYKKLVPYKKN